jgi:hypothetical protein
MKVFRIIVSILLAVGSVAVIGLAVLRGMDAPEGKKITDATPLVQNVATTEEGIEKFGNEISMMIGDDMLTREEIEAEQAKLQETETVHIPAYEAKVAEKKAAAEAAEATIKELGDKCLISHNEQYKPIHLSGNDSVNCCGRVIGIVEG